jgi:biopolymer transport protein ExbD
MADVMIVLLVIFMGAIPALDRDTGLRLPPAAQARSQRPEANALTLALRADGSVWLNGLPANTGSSRPVATTATAAALGPFGLGAEVLMGAASELGARFFVCPLGARPGRWALVD